MEGYAKSQLIGNLTRDVELRQTTGGTSVANFPIAVNKKFKSGEELKEEVSFFDIVCFGKLADVCNQFLSKGGAVFVEARPNQRKWEADDGTKRSRIEFIATEVKFLSRPGGANEPTSALTDDDVPF